jgi:hypothetical protein
MAGIGNGNEENVSDMRGTSGIEDRLEQAATLPETLAASFDAFEAIRIAARERRDRVPELFAAFMTAADAAVDGREALTIGSSLQPAGACSGPTCCSRRPGRTSPRDLSVCRGG